MKRVRRITTHVGYGMWLGGAPTIGFIPRQAEIRSPYAYSPVHNVYAYRGMRVIAEETAHRVYDVFEIPNSMTVHLNEDDAEAEYIRSRRSCQDE